ncbi:DUF3426 domain-containing protein [Bordetella flabilis]|uniref:Zinc finger/thioredoxin putative domain-containing protein n=1 Tax=Bordetella flabilis TaxID=463014 RepID=A0A193GIA2_9BORD|nr:DUF3426 domain-containing protein [Bordetella flabilis]ANN79565.1 hypothetical protein BAU07_22770 [Bordetella flabilis]
MTMTTRCPHCGTAFKVVADQLRVRNGLVRCGVCSRVFDGYAAVVDGSAPPALARPLAVRPDAPEYQGAASPVLSVQAPTPEPYTPPPSPQPHTPHASAQPPALASGPSPHAPRARDEAMSTPVSEPAYRQPAPAFPHRPAFQDPAAVVPSRPASPARDAGPSHRVQEPSWDTGPSRPAQQPPRDTVPSRPVQEPSWDTGASRPVQEPSWDTGASRPAQEPPWDTGASAPWERGASSQPVAAAPTIPPAVLRGREDHRRTGPGRTSAQQERHPDPWADDADGNDDESGFREPYAPYRQDDVGDAEQQARDMAPAASDRYRIYARREIIDDEPEYVPIPGEARTRYDDTVDTGMAPPVFMDEEVQRRRSIIARLWALGCLLGLIVLALQAVYVYRTSIAAAVPGLRPALEAVCRQVGCEVGYARRLERISFTASSLQPPSGAAGIDDGRMRLVLAVTMRNRYDKAQPWPALVLQLTDLSDTVVVRKVILPENYLPPGTQGPFPAGGEQSITVPLQVVGLHVNGYQLDKFFP